MTRLLAAVFASVPLLTACSASVSEKDSDSEQSVSDSTTAALDLADGLSESATGQLENQAVGFALQSIGIEGQQVTDADIQALASQLQEIQAELNALVAEISQMEQEIAKEIAESTYQARVGQLDTPVSQIQSLSEQMCVFTSESADYTQCYSNNGSSSPAPNLDDPQSEAQQIATQAIEQLPSALAEIHDSIYGTNPGEQSLLGIWSQVNQLSQPTPTFNDTAIYKNGQKWQQEWTQIQVQGLNLLVEAYHFDGENDQAQGIIDNIWSNIREQFQIMGVPMNNDNVTVDVLHGTAWYRHPNCYTTSSDNSSLLTQNTVNIRSSTGHSIPHGTKLCVWATELNDKAWPSNLPTDLSPWDGWGSVGLPDLNDVTNLYKGNGFTGSNAWQELNDQGFNIPEPKGATDFTNPSHAAMPDDNPSLCNLNNNFQIADGECNTQAGTPISFGIIAKLRACQNGGTNLPVLAMPCGTAWVDQFWPANPPPPNQPLIPSSSPSASSS